MQLRSLRLNWEVTMPIRVKSRKQPGADDPPRSPSPMGQRFDACKLPDIQDDDSFREMIKKLSVYVRNCWFIYEMFCPNTNNSPGSYFNAVVVLPVTFEQLRTTSAGQGLRNLVEHLSMECSHPAIVNALL